MVPIVCIVGRSGTGKTTLIERLLPELKARGYRVAVIKHTHMDVDWDQPGKDTWKFAKAGADQVVLATPKRVLANTPTAERQTFEQSLRFIGGGYDILIVEGFHETPLPKIEVHRQELGRELVTDKHGLMALVTDEKMDVAAPQFAWDDAKGVADLIVRKLLSSSDALDVGLFVNGQPVKMTPFVAEIIAGTVRGTVSALKGGGDGASDIDLWIRQKPM
jgi:molybdopterin-guanine dinucleotide biosynthesis protein MobB